MALQRILQRFRLGSEFFAGSRAGGGQIGSGRCGARMGLENCGHVDCRKATGTGFLAGCSSGGANQCAEEKRE
jgi:hypothetical protein